MVTHIQIDDRPACPRNCTTYQQYGDCGHQRPSEIVDLKRENAALRDLVLQLGEAFSSTEGLNAVGCCVWCARGMPLDPAGGHLEGAEGPWHECKRRFEPLLARYRAVKEGSA